ncbi:FecR domain-containing protein [Asticcacaulis sp. AC402]|uniref:FecR family protein n=1 Tax=Asticcacaulis sp. AC402 TaxID=1282361 RepID=UPI0003C3ACD2|nr:FecR domain-containing protein [Asticcacaulis sp. AC402]ESQ74269.1 hypothetical protein ABAC402_14985 [Asticcacaulis sp. AC402]
MSLYLWPHVKSQPVARPEDAAAWVARLMSDQCTQADRSAYEQWASAHPAEAEQAEAMRRQMQTLSLLSSDPLIARQLNRVRNHTPDRRALFGGMAAAVIVGVGLMITPALIQRHPVYETRIGETRTVKLDDGSVLLLNSRSRVRIDYSDTERRIWLDEGQVRFEVAKDRHRPFRVFAATEEVRALGTVFDVRRDGARVQVLLEEGSVAIFYQGDTQRPASATPQTRAMAVLKPGQSAETGDPGHPGAVAVKAADIKVMGAWRFGLMVMEDRPLAEAVAEINRYNTRQIVLIDPTIADIRISGVFQTGRPEAFAEAVTAAFPVEIAHQGGDTVQLRAAPGI